MNYMPNQFNQQVPQQQNVNLNQFNQMLHQQRQVSLPTAPNQALKIGTYMYVDTYEEVVNAQVPMNGNPMLFIGHGVMWSKKFENGQPYISSFNFAPVVNSPQTAEVEPQAQSTEDKVLNILNDLNKRLGVLETKGGKPDEHNASVESSTQPTASPANDDATNK